MMGIVALQATHYSIIPVFQHSHLLFPVFLPQGGFTITAGFRPTRVPCDHGGSAT
jgi:hypothetical protein